MAYLGKNDQKIEEPYSEFQSLKPPEMITKETIRDSSLSFKQETHKKANSELKLLFLYKWEKASILKQCL